MTSGRVGPRWAYLGPQGTFTEQAALDLAGFDPADTSTTPTTSEVELVPYAGVGTAVAAVRAGDVAAAVVPLENSVEGSVPLTHDELTHGEPLVITAETFVAVTFALLVRPGTALKDVRTIGSHPHGLAQIRDWMAATLPDAELIETGSTAAAAAAVAAGQLDGAAAAPVAGARYGLAAIANDIGARRDAVTRFVRLEPPCPAPRRTGNDRTSLILAVANVPGSLLSVLTEFAVRGVNLTRLESRPTREMLGEYVFLVDADGHIADPAMADTVAALVRRGELRRFLGSYPRARGQAVEPPETSGPQAYQEAGASVARLQSKGF